MYSKEKIQKKDKNMGESRHIGTEVSVGIWGRRREGNFRKGNSQKTAKVSVTSTHYRSFAPEAP